jgi:hypothetical protein
MRPEPEQSRPLREGAPAEPPPDVPHEFYETAMICAAIDRQTQVLQQITALLERLAPIPWPRKRSEEPQPGATTTIDTRPR